jgi:hypothetical protein
MRRFLVLFTFAIVVGAALPALAQTTYQYTQQPYQQPYQQQQQYQQPYQQPQYSQSPPYGQPPRFEERRGRRDGLRILSAWYGIESRACDAERAVERICGGRTECTVPVTNRLCGDPAPNVVKVLTVTYACRGMERTTTRWEGRHMGLRCDPRGPRY